MAERIFTNAINSVKLGESHIVNINGFVFQKKADAENNDPVVKATSNGKHYIVVRGTYNHKAASYVFGETALPAPDGNGNVALYINCMVDDGQVELLNSARAVAGESIEIYGNAATGKAQEGRLPSLWVANAQVTRLKAKKDDGGAVKVEKNIASVSGKGYGDAVQTMSLIRGVVRPGYDNAPAVSEGKTVNGKEYSRFTVEVMLDQHEHAIAFGDEDGNAGPSRRFVRCSTWGFANDRVRSLGLKAGDTVILMGTTSQYVSERTTQATDQMNVSRIVSRFPAPVENAPAQPAAPAPTPAAKAPAVEAIAIDDFEVADDDYDLPF